MPGTSGLELQTLLGERGYDLPVIFLTGHGDVRQSVLALKRGAVDFLEKPYDQDMLHERLGEVITDHAMRRRAGRDDLSSYVTRRAALTPREREIMDLVVAGLASKEIAREARHQPPHGGCAPREPDAEDGGGQSRGAGHPGGRGRRGEVSEAT